MLKNAKRVIARRPKADAAIPRRIFLPRFWIATAASQPRDDEEPLSQRPAGRPASIVHPDRKRGPSRRRPNPDPDATPYRYKLTDRTSPTNQGVLVGSDAAVARMPDEVATVPGVNGVTLTFDHFVIGTEQFGQRIHPLMKSRAAVLAA